MCAFAVEMASAIIIMCPQLVWILCAHIVLTGLLVGLIFYSFEKAKNSLKYIDIGAMYLVAKVIRDQHSCRNVKEDFFRGRRKVWSGGTGRGLELEAPHVTTMGGLVHLQNNISNSVKYSII